MRSKIKKQVIIDRQILALHEAMVEKVLDRPELIKKLNDNLDRYRSSKLLGYGTCLLWQSILDAYESPSLFRQLVLAPDARSAQLRRQTIFSGVLTEDERENVLTNYIASELQ